MTELHSPMVMQVGSEVGEVRPMSITEPTDQAKVLNPQL